MLDMLIICLFLCHTFFDWSSASANVCPLWFVLMCYFVSCSEEKSDEVTNLLGEVRSVL